MDRESELKHGRLAMLAAMGWPLAELFNPLALRATGGRALLFNGQLVENALPRRLRRSLCLPRDAGRGRRRLWLRRVLPPAGQGFMLAPSEKLEWKEKEVKNGYSR